ncbi:MAG TPA: hypothetical protein VJT75_02105 [Thermoleophilaceae bacterium]|nr:hypothetical protein [Thermoleophilaceae bacterium]
MTRLALLAAAAAAIALGGCGTATEDLMAIERSFPETGVHVRIRVTNDGRGSCGAGTLQRLPSQTLLDARGVKRSLRPLARRGASFSSSRPDRSSYVFRSFDGVVRWTEGTRGPRALARAALLELRLERLLCRA